MLDTITSEDQTNERTSAASSAVRNKDRSWREITAHDHFVQFYEEDAALIDSLAAFLGSGLGAGEGAVVIATPAHREALDQQLAAQGVDLHAVRARAQYVALDAAETLSRFMIDGSPDAVLFRKTIAPLMDKTARGRRGLRAFGEMVALLWAQGNSAAALRLEGLWNDLGKTHSFCLFCAYPLGGFGDAANSAHFEHICQAHSRVLPSERYFAASEDERLREIAALQQKALTLKGEIARRQQIELKLRRRESELTDFVENASIGLHWVGPDGIIQWANQADFEMLGYRAEEYIGRHIAEFHADQTVIEDILRRLAGGERLRDYEARLKCKDGSTRTVLIDSSVLWQNGQFLHTQCFTRDITQHTQAEQALRQSEERHRQLLSLMPSAVYTCDLEGRITFFNRRAAELWGREPALNDQDQRFCGSFKLWLTDGSPLPHALTPMATAIEQGTPCRNQEVVIERPDGSRVVVIVNIDPLFDDDGKQTGAINVFQDITEQKRSEENLCAKENQLRLVTDQAPVYLAHCDSQSRYLFVNEPYAARFGATRSEIVGKSIREVVGHRAFEQIYPYVQRALAGESVEFELEIREKVGTRCMFVRYLPERDESGRIHGFVAAIADITERKRVEESVAQLAAIVEHSDDAILSTNLDGIIHSWNRGAQRLYGYTASEVIGQPVTLLLPEGRQDEEPGILNKIRSGQAVEHYETVRRRKDGSLFDVSLTVSPVKNLKGEIIGASKVARDITDKVRAREKLEETVAVRTASLREAFAQMEEFSYSVSHDLRAPLRAINAYATVLIEDYSPQLDENARGYLQKIQRSSDRMNRLTQDVLSYSRLARAQVRLQPVSVESLVKDVIHQYANLQEPYAQIETATPLLDVLGHEVTLGQCIANLLNNAVKFVSPNIKPLVRISTESLGSTVRLWVEDNGIGVTPEHQHRIFQMFERVHPEGQYEGTGIGLTIVRKAVEKMGGTAGVHSDGLHGSRFWIELRAPEAA